MIKSSLRLAVLAGIWGALSVAGGAMAQFITITDGLNHLATTCTSQQPPPTGGTYRFSPDGCLYGAAATTDPKFRIVIEPQSITQQAAGTGARTATVYAEATAPVAEGKAYPLVFNVCTASQGCNPAAGGWDFIRYGGIGGTGLNAQSRATTGSYIFTFQPGRDAATNSLRMGLGQIEVPDSPALNAPRTVKFGLTGPWAASLDPVSATITGAQQSSVDRDVNGREIPSPTGDPTATYPCEAAGGGPYPGTGTGPCGSYQVFVQDNASAINCSAGMNPGNEIQMAWQYNLFYNEGRVNSMRFSMKPRDAISFRFTTPTEASASAGWFPHLGGVVTDEHTANGPIPGVYLSISEKRCDFNRSALANATRNFCHATSNVGFVSPSIVVRRENDNSPPSSGECTLRPGKNYYINLRFEDAARSPGITLCDASSFSAGTCGLFFQLR